MPHDPNVAFAAAFALVTISALIALVVAIAAEGGRLVPLSEKQSKQVDEKESFLEELRTLLYQEETIPNMGLEVRGSHLVRHVNPLYERDLCFVVYWPHSVGEDTREIRVSDKRILPVVKKILKQRGWEAEITFA